MKVGLKVAPVPSGWVSVVIGMSPMSSDLMLTARLPIEGKRLPTAA